MLIFSLKYCILEKLFKHGVVDEFGPVSVEFDYLLILSVEGVESAELASAVAEEDQKVFALGASDLFEDALLGLAVDHAREDAVLDRIQNDGSVASSCWLLVQSRT